MARFLLHTIAIEPARWTEKRVSRPLIEIIPEIAKAGFSFVEIYEPHLRIRSSRPDIRRSLNEHGIQPVVLSSYIDAMAKTESDFAAQMDSLLELTDDFAFTKIRIFPGLKVSPTDNYLVDLFIDRIGQLASRLSPLSLLLETHDGSLADDPHLMVHILQLLNLSNVGLLYQPTVFTRAAAEQQFALHKPYIRHFHLQNRDKKRGFATLAEGVVPWRQFLNELPDIDRTLEFIPTGIRSEIDFDLSIALKQASSERDSLQL